MFWQVLKLALENIRKYKVRSLLTMLGVVIGVMSVIFIAAIISGLNLTVSRQVQSLGSNIVSITRLPQFAFNFPTEEERQRKELTLEDAQAVREQAKNAEVVTTILPLDFGKFPNPNISYKNVHAANVKVYGVEPDYINVYTSYVHSGRFISDGDVSHRTKVIVLGMTVAQTMFPNQDPVGKVVNFESDAYDVVGVLERRGSLFGFDRDNFVWIPVTTMLKLHPEAKDTLMIAMKATSQEASPLVIDEATEIIEFYQQLTGGAYLVMMVISSIALMVSGIGVMNIMLVSVTERTREIGVRKAMGARRRDILGQFLLEAMVLTGTAGVLGILLASGVSMLVDKISPLPSRVSVLWVIIAFTVSVSVGLFFGIYPAARASKLDPIEALRYE
jgi:putative ABC transport system permease protein